MVTPRSTGTREFSVHATETGELFAIRRGRVVPLDTNLLKIVIEDEAGQAAEFFFREVVITSPVDTGLLRSRWVLLGNVVSNDTPYLPHVSRRNPWIQRAWEELQFYLQTRRAPRLPNQRKVV